MSTTTGKRRTESNEPLAIVARRIAASNPAVAEKLQAISDARVGGKGNPT